MSKYWSKKIKDLKPYTPGEQPGEGERLIKINTNENPYPPSTRVAKAIEDEISNLALYPSPCAFEAVKAFADKYNIPVSNVFAGNGSDEVLAFSFMALFDPEKEVLMPDITYSFYTVYCNLYGLKYRQLPLNSDFTIDIQSFISEKGNIVIANPNAPTSVALPIEDIEKIISAHKDDVIIIDEAYIDFGGKSVIELIKKYENLLVIRTLSKSYALAGMRIGFAVGNDVLIEGLNRVKNSFNSYTLDRLAIKAAKAALEDSEYFNEITQKVISTRERIAQILKELDFNVLDSSANFLFVTHKRYNAVYIQSYLRKNRVLVRHFDNERINDYLRISVGTDSDMDTLISLLRKMK